jgi:hypothetical protein
MTSYFQKKTYYLEITTQKDQLFPKDISKFRLKLYKKVWFYSKLSHKKRKPSLKAKASFKINNN